MIGTFWEEYQQVVTILIRKINIINFIESVQKQESRAKVQGKVHLGEKSVQNGISQSARIEARRAKNCGRHNISIYTKIALKGTGANKAGDHNGN